MLGRVRRLGLVFTVLALLLAAAPAEGAAPLVRHTVPGTGFAIGQVKWHSFDPSDCTIQSLFTNESGTTQEYRSTSVSLNAAETQLTIGQAIYTRE